MTDFEAGYPYSSDVVVRCLIDSRVGCTYVAEDVGHTLRSINPRYLFLISPVRLVVRSEYRLCVIPISRDIRWRFSGVGDEFPGNVWMVTDVLPAGDDDDLPF